MQYINALWPHSAPFTDATVDRKCEAWQNYIAQGKVTREHCWHTIAQWHHVGLITDAQRKKMMQETCI